MARRNVVSLRHDDREDEERERLEHDTTKWKRTERGSNRDDTVEQEKITSFWAHLATAPVSGGRLQTAHSQEPQDVDDFGRVLISRRPGSVSFE